jgi:hypothetical protein
MSAVDKERPLAHIRAPMRFDGIPEKTPAEREHERKKSAGNSADSRPASEAAK